MHQPQPIALLEERIQAARDKTETLEAWKANTETVLRAVMGDTSHHVSKFNKIRYTPGVITSDKDFAPARQAGIQKGIAVLEAAVLDLQIRGSLNSDQSTGTTTSNHTQEPAATESLVGRKRIFLVHGHDTSSTNDVRRIAAKLTGIEPTVLSEEPAGGKTIIESFENHAEQSDYALVLLTADDHVQGTSGEEPRPRARQNVVFEAGYFAGSLGRSKVLLMYTPGVEIPSDISGVRYVELDSFGGWHTTLAKELRQAGFDVDADGLL